MNLKDLLDKHPYSLDKEEKLKYLDYYIYKLTKYHYKNCKKYKKMLDSVGFDIRKKFNAKDIPFLPVRLFKMHNLSSVPDKKIVKTMTSSGTSGQLVSKIFLDKETSLNQTKTLTKIVSSFIGTKRSPMLIIDNEDVINNRNNFSARAAGVLGFSIFGNKKLFALDKNMNLNVDLVEKFISDNKHNRIFLFGFTFMIYQHFIRELQNRKRKFDLSSSILIHGGGWKKLASESVISSDFRKMLKQLCGISSVYDYYGMVEQTGSIYMECEYENLHTSIFSDIIIRKSSDFSEAKLGEIGIIQTISILPKSYPGHSLLTDDEGVLVGEDDCKCGRLGKYFKIIGRVKNAEIRGCSDTYAEQF